MNFCFTGFNGPTINHFYTCFLTAPYEINFVTICYHKVVIEPFKKAMMKMFLF